MADSYNLDTKKLYKIWFSKDRDSFLSTDNQLRMIRTKQNNPDATISLIYSASLLSKDAQSAMKDFCTKNKITSVDFDTEILLKGKTDQENSCFKLIKDELDNLDDDKGGNAAAASDILRFSQLVAENYGIYSDCDVNVKFKEAPKTLQVEQPIIIGKDCNDVIAFATNNDGTLHTEAINKIDTAQKEILMRYDSVKSSNSSKELLDRTGEYPIGSPEAFFFVDPYYSETQDNRSLPSLRAFMNKDSTLDNILNFCLNDQEISKDLKGEIQNRHKNKDISPELIFAKVVKEKYPGLPERMLKGEYKDKWFECYKNECKKSLVMNYSGPNILSKTGITRKNSYTNNNMKNYVQAQGDKSNDLSWVLTKNQVKNKEEVIHYNAKKIQKAWKSKHNGQDGSLGK